MNINLANCVETNLSNSSTPFLIMRRKKKMRGRYDLKPFNCVNFKPILSLPIFYKYPKCGVFETGGKVFRRSSVVVKKRTCALGDWRTSCGSSLVSRLAGT